LNRITAGKLIVGSTAGGNVRVASAVTTADTAGDLTLRTAENIDIANNLTVGTTGTKNLTLEAAGANSSVGGAGVVKANALKITGANATVAMAAVAHQVNTLSADVKALAFKNSQALKVAAKASGGDLSAETTNGTLTVGVVDGVTGLTAKGNITAVGNATSGSGLSLESSITSNEGDVTLQGSTASTTAFDAGITAMWGIEVSGKNVKVDGKATAVTTNTTLGFRGAVNKFIASGKLDLAGSTQGTGSGFYAFGDEFTASSGVTVTGSSKSGHGVKFDQNGSGGTSTKLSTSTGGIAITGSTENATTRSAITLNGTNIVSNGGDIVLTASQGKVDTTTQYSTTTNTIIQNADADVRITTVDGGHNPRW
jgi:hypothetical protein